MKGLKKELLIHFILVSIFFLFYLFCTGNLTSFYFRQDDHEFFSLSHDIKAYGFWKTYLNTNDLNGSIPRIRYLYYLLRCFFSYLFGPNLLAQHLVVSSIISGCSTLLYGFARRLQIHPWAAAFFSLFVFMGTQSEIIFRLGPNEPTGLIFFAAALYMTAGELSRPGEKKESGLIVLSLMGASFCKESFLVAIPAVLLLRIALSWARIGKLKQAFATHLLSNLSLILFLSITIALMVLNGKTNVGYAGIDASSWWRFLPTTQWFMFQHLYAVFGLCLVYHLLFAKQENKLKFIILASALGVILTQLVLYAKSGFYREHRFLIPILIAPYLVMSLYLSEYVQKMKVISWYKRAAFLPVLLLTGYYLFSQINISFQQAQSYAKETKEFTHFLEEVSQSFQKTGKPVLFIGSSMNFHEELLISIPAWMKHLHKDFKYFWHAPLAMTIPLPYVRQLYQQLSGMLANEIKVLNAQSIKGIGTIGIFGPHSRVFLCPQGAYHVFTDETEKWNNLDLIIEKSRICFLPKENLGQHQVPLLQGVKSGDANVGQN